MIKQTNVTFRFVQAITLVILLAVLIGCTSLSPSVEITQTDIDYFRSESIRMVTEGFYIELDNGNTLIPVSQGEYDTNKPIKYRVQPGDHPRFYVTIPMVTRSGGKAQELEFDMETRQPVNASQIGWMH